MSKSKVNPLITIGLTCFNSEDLIIDSVKSALRQDWPNFEIVIVDDGSSDASVRLISDFSQDHDCVRLIVHEENKGFPSALNTIIENAKGEFIAFFDDDDVSDPARLRLEYERISSFIAEKNTDLVMCYTGRNVVDADTGNQICNFHGIGTEKGYEPYGEMVADYILWHSGKVGMSWGMFGSCTLMVCKRLFDQIGKFDPQFKRSAEWDMAIRNALAGGYFISVPDVLITQTKTHTADKGGRKPLLFSLKLREKHKDYLRGKGVYWASRLIAYSRFYKGKGNTFLYYFCWCFAIILSPFRMVDDILQKAVYKLRKNNNG